MKKKIHNLIHKKLIIIVILTQLFIVFGGTAMSVAVDAQEKNQQYFEYTETMRHLEEHLQEHNENKFEMSRAMMRTNLRAKMREADYYTNFVND